MHYQTRAELWSSVSTHFRSPGALVNKQTLLRRVLIGMIALILAYQGLSHYLTRAMDAGPDSPETLAILVADRYIPAYSPVKPRFISVRNFPRGYIPPGALHANEELVDTHGQPLFISAVPIPEGQPVTRTLMIDVANHHGIASLLAPGKVAVSFAVDKVRGVGNWIQPGDTIAIFQTPTLAPPGHAASRSHVLFRSLRVLAVDKNRLGTPSKDGESKESPSSFMETPEENGSVITVLLNSFEASLLIDAQEQGHLTAALHAVGDDLVEEPHGK